MTSLSLFARRKPFVNLLGLAAMVAALLMVTAAPASATPLAIYTRWVGDDYPLHPNPPGAFMQYCDWDLQGIGSYGCFHNQDFGTANNIPELADPVGGIGGYDFNHDGQVDWIALSGNGPTSLDLRSGTMQPDQGRVLVEFDHTTAGMATLARTGTTVGFGVGYADADGSLDVVVAYTTDHHDLKVDVFDHTGGLPKRTHTLIVPGMTTVDPRSPTSDFLGFTVGDYDFDGTLDLMVLHRSELALDSVRVSIFRADGSLITIRTLGADPVAGSHASAPAPFGTTYVGGIAFAPFAPGGGANEFAIVTVDYDPNADARLNPAMRLSLWRYDSLTGAPLAPRKDIQPAPYFGRAIVVGISALAQNDNNCNGFDEDHDGTPDNHFFKPVQTCGIGACQVTRESNCLNGVLTGAEACMPAQPSTEALDGLDDDCDGAVDNNLSAFPPCAPGQTDWWCCPQGALHFQVNAVQVPGGPVIDNTPDDDAALSCVPVGVPMSSSCSLRGVVRRAAQLRAIPGVRPLCPVVAELAPGVHELRRQGAVASHVVLGAGDLTLVGQGSDPGQTIIKASTQSGGALRILYANSYNKADSTTVTIRNLTMSGGNAGSGGAIFAEGATQPVNTPRLVTLTLDNVIVEKSRANQPGGGLNVSNSELVIRDSLFRQNSVDNWETIGGVTSLGGALYASDSDVLIERSAFVGNAASKGGGLYIATSRPQPIRRFRMVNSLIGGNYCAGHGCGIELIDVDVTLRFSTITENHMVTPLLGANQVRFAPGLVGKWDPNRGATRLNMFGNIIAGNAAPNNLGTFTNSDGDHDGISPDCHVELDPGTLLVGASNNLIGSGDWDCALLGTAANDPLIGKARDPFQGSIDPQDPPLNPALGAIPQQGTCQLGAETINCRDVCATATGPAACLAIPNPTSLALGRGVAVTCPADDQRWFLRAAGQNCTLGSYDANGQPDSDHDGIANSVDPTPTAMSMLFSDDKSFGRTSGSIVNTGGNQVIIEDATGLQNGVTVRALSQGGTAPAVISLCGTTLNVQPNESVIATCPPAHGPFFAAGAASLGNDSTVSGDVYGATLGLGTGNQIAGQLLCNGNASVGPGSALQGNATLHGLLTGYRAAANGTLSENAAVTPPLAVFHSGVSSVTTALAVHNVASGVDLTLAPGNYGDVTIDAGATLMFSASGLYRLKSLKAFDDVTIVGAADGNTTVLAVDGNLSLGDRFSGSAGDGGASVDFLIYTNGSTAQVGHDLFLPGTIETPLAPMTVGNNAYVFGGVAASTLAVGNNAVIDTDDADDCASNLLPAVAAVSSSNENSSLTAAKAIDGDPASRWSSTFSDPQWIYVDLGANRFVNRVVLSWEAAYSSNFSIQIAQSASGPWIPLRSNLFGRAGISSINGLGAVGRYVRTYSTARATPYGVSLFDFKVYGDTNTICAGPAPLPTIAAVSSSNESSALGATNAIDGSFSTRWSSAFSDGQSIYVDLGAPRTVKRVRLSWEVAYSNKYDIRVSNDASNWTTVFSTDTSNGGIDDVNGLNVSARYVKMVSRGRATVYGSSLWEMRVYGAP